MLLRLLLIFVGVCAFGVLDAIVKGHHGGMRNVIGNISAPWAILPILAGSIAVPRRLAVGALAGVASTVAALASYALARGESLRLSQSGGATLATISPIGNRWFLLGLVGGIALGASGSWFAAPSTLGSSGRGRRRPARVGTRGARALGGHAWRRSFNIRPI